MEKQQRQQNGGCPGNPRNLLHAAGLFRDELTGEIHHSMELQEIDEAAKRHSTYNDGGQIDHHGSPP